MRAHPLLAGLKPARRLDAAYFDTPDLALKAAGYSLRVRSDGKRRIQTIKTLTDGAGVWDRGEWERPTAADTPDLAAARDTPLAALLDRAGVAEALQPCFRIEVARASGLLRRPGLEVEISLDEGEARTGEAKAPVRELELELKHGAAIDLFDLGRDLFETLPLRLSARSKAQAGYDLIAAPDAAAAEEVVLDRDMSAAEALRTIGRACLLHFLRNEALVRARRTEASVHQARVAVRRLRAAMTLFKALVDDPESLALKGRLRDLAATLGAARDFDVLIARLARLETAAPVDRLALSRALERRREAAYDEAVRTLDSPEVGRLGFDIAAWLEAGAWRTAATPLQAARRAEPVIRFAAAELSRRARKLRKEALRLESLDPGTRHEVRKHAKKVRYGAEFFRSLARKKDRKAAKTFIEALKPLQETLGELNDIAEAHALLQALAAEAAGGPVFAAGAVAEELSAGQDAALAAAVAAAKTFAKADLFL